MKSCFVICPLDHPRTKTRVRSDAILTRIIDPVVSTLGYKVQRADLTREHQWTLPEMISKHIFESDLVVADLTDCNANVFYELGKRHAWGGRTVHLSQDLSTLPFDIRHHRVIKYDLEDATGLDDVRIELREAIASLESVPIKCPFPLTPAKIIELSNATVLIERKTGRRDHYDVAKKIANTNCQRIFLMQRSSSLILGPEMGWGGEEKFYTSLLNQVEAGAQFFHVVSLEGIARHKARPQSTFPNLPEALSRLSRIDESVGIAGPNNTWYFKRVADEEDDRDLKPDRQARTFLVEFPSGETEGVVVVDLGGSQSCFYLRGPMMHDFLNSCVGFYDGCPLLKWSELERVLSISSNR